MNTAQQVITFIQRNGPASRAEVARRLGRSKPATSAAIEQLLARGLLTELGQGRRGVGRPPMLLALNTRARLVVGAEVDVNELRVGLGDLHGDLLVLRASHWTGGLGEALALAVRELAEPYSGASVQALALGLPGVVEGGALRYAPNLPDLEVPGAVDRLCAGTGAPTLAHNDVNLAAVSEARPGELLAYLSIGSGCGVGLTEGKRLILGHRGRAGELGYLPTAGGEPLERLLSEAGLCRALGFSPWQLASQLAGRDPPVLQSEAARPFLDGVLQALQILTLTLDPARIVIGGRIGCKLSALLPALGRRLAHSLPFCPQLSVSSAPERAVVLGALRMAAERAHSDLLHELGGLPRAFA